MSSTGCFVGDEADTGGAGVRIDGAAGEGLDIAAAITAAPSEGACTVPESEANSRAHLEHRLSLAAFPQKPHPARHCTGSGTWSESAIVCEFYVDGLGKGGGRDRKNQLTGWRRTLDDNEIPALIRFYKK